MGATYATQPIERTQFKTASAVLGSCDVFIAVSLILASWFVSEIESIQFIMRVGATCSIVPTSAFVVHYFRSKSVHADTVVQLAFLFWYVLPILMWEPIELSGIVIEPTKDHVTTALFAVFLVKGLFGISVMLTGRLSELVWELPDLARSAPISGIVVISIIGIVPLLLTGGGFLQNLSVGRAEGSAFRQIQMNDGGPWLTLAGFALPVAAHLGAISYLLEPSPSKKRVLLFLAGGLVIVLCLAGGTRTMLFVFVMPTLSILLRTVRIKLRHVLTIFLVAALMVAASEAMVRYRDLGIEGMIANQSSDTDIRVLKDNDFYSEFVYSVSLFPDVYSFSYESPIAIAVLNLIPRAWWTAKLDAKNSELFMRVRMNQPSGELMGNILPGMIGQYWQVSGYVGLFSLIVWLRAFTLYATKSIRSVRIGRSYLGYLVAWTVFIGFRNLGGGLIVPGLLTSLSFLAIEGIFRIQKVRMPERNPVCGTPT